MRATARRSRNLLSQRSNVALRRIVYMIILYAIPYSIRMESGCLARRIAYPFSAIPERLRLPFFRSD